MAADDPADVEFKPGLLHQAGEFVRAIKGEAHSLATLDDATQSMRLVARIYGRD
jgi:predicted dehydrogenase